MPIMERRSVRAVKGIPNYLKENPAICDEIEQKVRDFYQLDGSTEDEAEAADETKTAAKAEKKAEKKQESEE